MLRVPPAPVPILVAVSTMAPITFGENGRLVSGAVHRVLIYFRTEIQHR
jgi:hypothetical protein